MQPPSPSPVLHRLLSLSVAFSHPPSPSLTSRRLLAGADAQRGCDAAVAGDAGGAHPVDGAGVSRGQPHRLRLPLQGTRDGDPTPAPPFSRRPPPSLTFTGRTRLPLEGLLRRRPLRHRRVGARVALRARACHRERRRRPGDPRPQLRRVLARGRRVAARHDHAQAVCRPVRRAARRRRGHHVGALAVPSSPPLLPTSPRPHPLRTIPCRCASRASSPPTRAGRARCCARRRPRAPSSWWGLCCASRSRPSSPTTTRTRRCTSRRPTATPIASSC